MKESKGVNPDKAREILKSLIRKSRIKTIILIL